MKFRLKFIPNIGYYPQVCIGGNNSWKTIVRVYGGFTLMVGSYTCDPLTKNKAREYCQLYYDIVTNENNAEYIEVVIK